MKSGCKARCLAYCQKHAGEWISKHKIVDLARIHGNYTGDQTSVRLRELERAGELEGKKDEKGHQYYRWNGGTERRRIEGLKAFDSLPIK